MKLNSVITAGIAASLLSSIAAAQTATTPRARSVQVFAAQKSGSYLGIGGMDVTSERMQQYTGCRESGRLVVGAPATDDQPD